MPGERKLVTVLFADIVGSTAAGRAHDPEVVRGTLGGAFERLREVLETHGGTVEKFIGDAVMAVFGVPIAHDDDADRAVRAAFLLRSRIAEYASPFPIELRIGVNSGEVVSGSGEGGQFLVTGEAVNAAARIQQAAAPGEILVGALTHQLTSRSVRYGRKRAVKAKGIGGVEVWPADELASELPEQRRGIEGLTAPLIGRDEEMRLLLDTHRRVAADGKPALVTVFATAGSGKSRLTQELIDTIGDTRVRRGRCLPYGEGITFWPITEILRADAGITATDAREDATHKLRAAVLAAVGDASEDADAVARRISVLAGTATAAEALPGIAADAVADELRWGLRRYIDRRAAGGALTLVFEDIHWAEPGLLDAIEHLADRLSGPVFILCLARPELLEGRPGWAGGKTNATSISLEPLSEDETRRLIAELLAIDALPDNVRREVVTRAEGNPLYVEEFLRMLIESGQVEKRRGKWVATESIAQLVVPPTIQGLIAARLDRLPPEVKRTLLRAAVVGKVFWTSALDALDGEGGSRGTLTEALRRGMVHELDERGLGGGAAYRFKHIIVRDVAYAAIPKSDRLTLHDRFSRWLEQTAGERAEEYVEIIGHHAEQAFLLASELGHASAQDLGVRAFALTLSAAGKAKQRFDWNAMKVLYGRAAAVAERIDVDPALRAEARGFFRSAAVMADGRPDDLTALEAELPALRGLGPSEALVAALRTLAFSVLNQSSERARPFGYEAIEVARQLDDPGLLAQTILIARQWASWVGDHEEWKRLTEEAYAVASRGTALGPLGVATRDFGRLAADRGEFTKARQLFERAWQLASSSGARISQWNAASGMYRLALVLDGPETARKWAEIQSGLAREIGGRPFTGRGAEVEGDILYRLGDFGRSADVLRQGIAPLDPETMRGIIPELRWKLSRALLALGDLPGARREAELARSETGPDDIYTQGTTRAALAAVRAAEGKDAEAERLYREAIEHLKDHVSGDANPVRVELARFLVQRGRGGEARADLERLRDFYSDPAASRPRAEVEALLAQTVAVRA